MSTAIDPFAVSFYDPKSLPDVSARFLSSASTDVLAIHLLLDDEGAFEQPIEVYDFLATQVLASYNPGAWRILDPSLLFPSGVPSVSGGWEELAEASIPVELTAAQVQERRARLSAAIRLKALNSNEFPRANVRRALVHALDLETKVRKRDEAAYIAVVEGRYLAEGMPPEAALKATKRQLGCSLGKIRPLRSSSEYVARRDAQQGLEDGHRLRAVIYTHAADGWFAGKTTKERAASADRVAARVIVAMQDAMRGKSKKGKRPIVPPVHLRWDAFILVEGFAKRRLPLSPIACLMLDHALGLFDCDGFAVLSSFGGIRKREAFAAAAHYEGTEEGEGIKSTLDLETELRHRGYPTASAKQLRAWRRRESYSSITANSRATERRW